MKTKQSFFRYIFIALVAIIFSANTAHAQVVFKENSINIGNSKIDSPLQIKINGLNGVYWGTDTRFFMVDVSSGMFPAIAGSKDEVSFKNTSTGKVNNIMVANVFSYSDARAKSQISTLNAVMPKILSLRPVSYVWKQSNNSSACEGEKAISTSGPSDDTMQYGFLAQEVEEIIPDIVHTDEEGNKSINYIAIIPMLVQSIQELQATIDEQNTVIESLSSRIGGSALKQFAKVDYIISCTPNPTKGEITFTYTIGTPGAKATIIISNLTGTRVRSIDCSSVTAVTTNLSSLADGIYLATLVVDNNVRDSKQIVVSK